jgi:hypothetical protein
MGMSTHVCGVKEPDDRWKKMKAAWDACKEAGVTPPDEIDDFFEGDPEQGVMTILDHHACCKIYNHDTRNGFEIDISKLPAGIKVIRFYNSF